MSDGIAVAEKAAAPEHLIPGRRNERDRKWSKMGMIDRSSHLVFAAGNGAVAVNRLRGWIVFARPRVVVAGVTARRNLIVVGDHSGLL